MDVLKKRIVPLGLEVFLFLFVFTTLNREFLPFGMDLRYPMLLIALLLIGYSVVINRKKIMGLIKNKQLLSGMPGLLNSYFKKDNYLFFILTMLYISMLISMISWLNNGLKINMDGIKSSIILNGSNLIFIITFYLYKKGITGKKIAQYLIFSEVVLLISMLLVWRGYHLSQIMGGDYTGYYGGVENYNYFGEPFRLAGYAQDPNYASFFMVMSVIVTWRFIKNKWALLGVSTMSTIGFLFSASRTVTLGVVAGIFFIALYKVIKKYKPTLINAFTMLSVIGICVAPYIIMKLSHIIGLKTDLVSMSNRFVMWQNAVNLFEKMPLFGGGLSSFKSFFELNGGWYVQAHSTPFQLMSEQGILGLIIFITLFVVLMRRENLLEKYLFFVFLIFSLTSELVYLSLFPFLVALFPIINSNCDNILEEKV